MVKKPVYPHVPKKKEPLFPHVTANQKPGEFDINLLAKTEGDPISKYCCSICGDCAPEEFLEEGRFLDRITWLREHYQEKHPGKWGEMAPMTIAGGEIKGHPSGEFALWNTNLSADLLTDLIKGRNSNGRLADIDLTFNEAMASIEEQRGKVSRIYPPLLTLYRGQPWSGEQDEIELRKVTSLSEKKDAAKWFAEVSDKKIGAAV